MTKYMIKDTIYWLNAFPSENGVFDTLSLASIVQRLLNQNYDKLTNNLDHTSKYTWVPTTMSIKEL